MRKWTVEQDLEVMLAAENNPDHLRKAFAEVAKIIGRSTDSVVVRYYNFLLKKNMSVSLLSFAEKHDLSYVEDKNVKPKNERKCGKGQNIA